MPSRRWTSSERRFHQRVRQAWLFGLKHQKGCKHCGEKDARCLDFHHRDPKSKLFNLSDFSRSRSIKRIQKEMDKCDVVCANCHRKHHYRR